ncbi:epidermal differentiation-specific protein-like [Megalops cyprinoides]|uniref:epidermal differentiation-specific protein-like n=1 Tax=Megalops cyprinoides TaxID=118141 RepID=UPI00186557E2|nr:epidermal differentiation-specific protein-like [Megalops cyprinoides]
MASSQAVAAVEVDPEIVLYENDDGTGQKRTLRGACKNLGEIGMNNCVSRVEVSGSSTWALFEGTGYSGRIFFAGEGTTVFHGRDDDVASSCFPVPVSTEKPLITLTAFDPQQEKEVTREISCRTILEFTGLSGGIDYVVNSGVWMVECGDGTTRALFSGRGSAFPDHYTTKMVWEYFSQPVPGTLPSNAYAIYPVLGAPTVLKAEFLWDQAVEVTNDIQVDCYKNVNDTANKRTVKVQLKQNVQSTYSESFKLGAETNLKAGASFEVNYGLGKGKVDLSLSQTWRFEKGRTESFSKTEASDFSVDLSVEPHTTLTVNFVRRQITTTVPIRLHVQVGSHLYVEIGHLVSTDGTRIDFVHSEAPITPGSGGDHVDGPLLRRGSLSQQQAVGGLGSDAVDGVPFQSFSNKPRSTRRSIKQ